MIRDFLLFELERLDLVLNIVSLLLLASLLSATCLIEHDDFKLKFTLNVEQSVSLLLQLLQLCPVLLNHFLLQGLILLIQLKRLLSIDS